MAIRTSLTTRYALQTDNEVILDNVPSAVEWRISGAAEWTAGDVAFHKEFRFYLLSINNNNFTW
jgi:hypothetical protein